MLVNMKEMLAEAAKGGYAVGAFNFSTLEYGMAIVRASEELGIPVVLQHAPPHEAYVPLDIAGPIMLDLARSSTDCKALEWRTAVLGMNEKDQKRAYFRFTVADGRMAEAVHSIVGIDVEGCLNFGRELTGRPLFQPSSRTRVANGF